MDREKREQIATWPVKGATGSYALAYDEADHRLFDTTRKPPMLLMFDTESGKEVARLESGDGIDDVRYDAAHKRIYVTGGRAPEGDAFVDGDVAVYQQKDPDKGPSQFGACTSKWLPQLNRLYVSAPGVGDRQAAILVFEPQ